MDLKGALALSFKVIADWRVLFIAIAIMLAWAVLRYVGSVYHRRRPRPSARPPVAPRSPKASRAAGKSENESQLSDEGMIE